MNVYDSLRVSELLACHGYEETSEAQDADLVLLNTCHIREKAAEKVYSELGRIRKWQLKREENGRPLKLGVLGCVAQAEGSWMAERAPYVDFIVGPQSYHLLPELLAKQTRRKAEISTEFPPESKFDFLPARSSEGPVSAFLTIQEGCDKFCTFCVVPYTRGAEESRPVSGLLKEAEQLVASGARELTLLGQNVTAYHGSGPDGRIWDLSRLIRRLAEIEGLERIRYTTSHPRDMNDDLIAMHRDVEKLMPYLHLPVQSGSDKILKAMNRDYTGKSFKDAAVRLKEARPDLVLSSDFIVGFPGETEEDFQHTMDLAEQTGIIQAYSFKYSRRPGTPASAMRGQIKNDIAEERLQRLQELLNRQTATFSETMIGKTLPVLIERKGRHSGQLAGKSPYLQAVHFDAPEDLELKAGDIVFVEIEKSMPHSLSGRVCLGTDQPQRGNMARETAA